MKLSRDRQPSTAPDWSRAVIDVQPLPTKDQVLSRKKIANGSRASPYGIFKTTSPTVPSQHRTPANASSMSIIREASWIMPRNEKRSDFANVQKQPTSSTGSNTMPSSRCIFPRTSTSPLTTAGTAWNVTSEE